MEKKKKDGRLLRWDDITDVEVVGRTKHSPSNPGKYITDNNPYTVVDGDLFDFYSEIEEISIMPKPMLTNEYMFGKIFPLLEQCTGRKDAYKVQLLKDIERQNLEGEGKIVPEVSEEKEADLVKLKQEIKEYVKSLGSDLICGFTKLDRRYIAEGLDELFPYDNIMVLGMEMNWEQTMEAPHPAHKTGEHFVFRVYQEIGKTVHKVADFIRSKGHSCVARVGMDGVLKYPPHAVNAGLGQFTTSGLIATKEFGTRVRFCAINIEPDIPIDKPIDINMDEFCGKCRICYKVCPAGALTKDPIMYRGRQLRKTNGKKCVPNIEANHDCALCIKVCPLSMFGYEKCMEAIPQYYKYNTMEEDVVKNKLLNRKYDKDVACACGEED
ncbi:4Fe-4S double cluster binding domain-containing protein [Tepidibacter hydrothermalis]|uniref:4Fe-4S ferredoxin-type domain-containing protein n=1 Tax=Tepidibacter hydrothermalis TaxID=3036126 RepID=A0ABY8E7Q4_9FIRM|nr:4Fe-4S double cluster binding domain-containing protein [Tepidibacter hydrothermalis]WFD08889.1 hypothetical protein P4S50_10855 [Tepidibacter hydrothermalis]